MTLEQIANWKSQNNPLEHVLGKNSICPTITTRVAESDGGGINASSLFYCDEIDDTTDLRYLWQPKQAEKE